MYNCSLMNNAEMHHDRPVLSEVSQSPVERAMSLFISVSVRYPQGNMAQAAEIALACQKSGDNPAQLGAALLKQPVLVQRIVDIGNNAHQNHSDQEAPIDMSYERVSGVIDLCFYWAGPLMNLKADSLRELADGYMIEGKRTADASLRMKANDMIMERGKELGKTLSEITLPPSPGDYA